MNKPTPALSELEVFLTRKLNSYRVEVDDSQNHEDYADSEYFTGMCEGIALALEKVRKLIEAGQI